MSDRSIQESIKYLAGTHGADGTKLIDATVNSVDETARTCEATALTGKVGDIIPDVRLMSDADDGVLLIPTVGSTITVAISVFADVIMVGCSGLDKIILMGGDLGGMVKAIDLVIRLNKLENAYNDLVSKFNTHTHNVTATGAPTGPSLLPEPNTLALTVRADIENENILQG